MSGYIKLILDDVNFKCQISVGKVVKIASIWMPLLSHKQQVFSLEMFLRFAKEQQSLVSKVLKLNSFILNQDKNFFVATTKLRNLINLLEGLNNIHIHTYTYLHLETRRRI
ncbi:hypothetical protein BpHYR1_046218 [Brachionus plicatilis]|uniref:Uncharacterized protein n=1 Tax=Brachionus plicatilis TaxID=10195 RepID=A0A3M7SMT1_BRAPC|nr:hypothetical protein BpHYR1_046218 [Brachionus plicatilis]